MKSTNEHPHQGEIWLFDPNPIRRTEIGIKNRPCLILSHDFFNDGPSQLVIVVPCTSIDKQIFSHIPILPPEGGIKRPTFAMCEQIRAISTERLIQKFGTISFTTLKKVHEWVSDLIRLT